MSDIAAFILARLEDDETAAREAHEENPDLPWETDRVYDGIYGIDLHSTHPESDSYGSGEDLRMPREMAKHIARHDPARVLAEVAAKRAIVDRYERAQRNRRDHPDDLASAGAFLALHGVVKLLAQAAADHDDYREEWRVG